MQRFIKGTADSLDFLLGDSHQMLLFGFNEIGIQIGGKLYFDERCELIHRFCKRSAHTRWQVQQFWLIWLLEIMNIAMIGYFDSTLRGFGNNFVDKCDTTKAR